MRRRLGLKTVNPKATGDYKGLEKYIKILKEILDLVYLKLLIDLDLKTKVLLKK